MPRTRSCSSSSRIDTSGCHRPSTPGARHSALKTSAASARATTCGAMIGIPGGGRRLRRRSVPRNPAHRARPLSPRSTPRIAAHTVTVAAGSAPRSSTRRRSLPHRRRSPLPAPPPSPFARARRRSSLCGGPAREWRRRPPRRRRPPPSFPVPSALRPRYRLAHAHAPIQTTARPKKTPSGGLKVVSRRVQRTSRCRSAVRGSRKPTKKNQGVQQLPHPLDARAERDLRL